MKRRNFLRNVGIGAIAAGIPISAMAQIQRDPKNKFHAFVTIFDADALLKDNPHYAILDRYAMSTGFEKRHKLWLGMGYRNGKSTNDLELHILFESKFRGFYHDTDTGETKPLNGVIIKDKFLIDPDVDFKQQVNEAYDRFFDQVMRYHFGPNDDPTTDFSNKPFKKGMMDSRPAKKLS